MKRVLWFGFYDLRDPRNRILMSGLRTLGVEVAECRVDARSSAGLGKYLRLAFEGFKLRRGPWDCVVVGYPGINAVWLAKLMFRAPIVYDAFFSFYQSEVEDRGTCRPGSLRARLLFLAEWLNARFAWRTLLDTRAHVAYFVRTFGMGEKKYLRAPIGADDTVFRPSGHPAGREGAFIVEFHGTFIPLQGIGTILDAAKLLEKEKDIRFRLIGGGQTAPEMRKKAEGLRNVEFLGFQPPVSETGPSILAELRGADVVLGIFGTGRKTGMVVPNKVYEAMACGKAVVTAETPAVRELLRCGEDVLCVPAGDGGALADAILRLKRDPALRQKLGTEALKTFRARFTPLHIAEGLKKDLEEALGAIDA